MTGIVLWDRRNAIACLRAPQCYRRSACGALDTSRRISSETFIRDLMASWITAVVIPEIRIIVVDEHPCSSRGFRRHAWFLVKCRNGFDASDLITTLIYDPKFMIGLDIKPLHS